MTNFEPARPFEIPSNLTDNLEMSGKAAFCPFLKTAYNRKILEIFFRRHL